jgi:hypothetical protein
MSRYKHLFPVEKMAQAFKVSKSSYYYWQGHQVDKWDQINEPIVRQIRSIHTKSKQIYGSPRITQELHKQGWFVSHSNLRESLCPRDFSQRDPLRGWPFIPSVVMFRSFFSTTSQRDPPTG